MKFRSAVSNAARSGCDGFGTDVPEQTLHRRDDALIDLLVDDARHPPGALGSHLVADQLPVVRDGLGREPHRLTQEILVPAAGDDERQRPAQRRGDADGVEPLAHARLDHRPEIVVGQTLEGLRQTARNGPGDATPVFDLAEPARGPLGDAHAPQPCGQHVPCQEVILDEVPQCATEPVLPRGDDSGMWDGQAERVAEQRGDGEPVRQAADERGLGGGPDEPHPGQARFEDPGGDEHDGREQDQAGGAALHGVELRLAQRVVGTGPPGGGRGEPRDAVRWRRGGTGLRHSGPR